MRDETMYVARLRVSDTVVLVIAVAARDTHSLAHWDTQVWWLLVASAKPPSVSVFDDQNVYRVAALRVWIETAVSVENTGAFA